MYHSSLLFIFPTLFFVPTCWVHACSSSSLALVMSFIMDTSVGGMARLRIKFQSFTYTSLSVNKRLTCHGDSTILELCGRDRAMPIRQFQDQSPGHPQTPPLCQPATATARSTHSPNIPQQGCSHPMSHSGPKEGRLNGLGGFENSWEVSNSSLGPRSSLSVDVEGACVSVE